MKRWPQCPHVRQTLQDLALCRTPALGGHVTQCDHCGEVRYHYHSCGNRSCPQCGGRKRAAWLAKCQANLLPVPYFHVVFTLPHEPQRAGLGQSRVLYRLLFDSAKETLLEVAADPKHLGARIGVLMVLHTWGQKLEHHPHVHCVVPGGGLAIPAKSSGSTATVPGDQVPRWVSCRPNWFLPVRVLGQVFRGKYLAALRAAYQAGQLQFAGSTLPLASPAAWATSIRALYQKDWVVYAKEPFGGPEQVLKYLTGYTHRVALSNHRLVKLRGRSGHLHLEGLRRQLPAKEMTLEAVEFVRRFALHIIPKGLVRIRQYGLLAHRDRGERLALCRSLLAAGAGPAGTRDRVAAAECQWRIDGQRPVTEWGGTSTVSGRAQVGSAVSDGYLHTGGLGFAPGRIGGHDLVRLIPGCAASRGYWSTIAARVVAWVTYKRSGKPADPAG